MYFFYSFEPDPEYDAYLYNFNSNIMVQSASNSVTPISTVATIIHTAATTKAVPVPSSSNPPASAAAAAATTTDSTADAAKNACDTLEKTSLVTKTLKTKDGINNTAGNKKSPSRSTSYSVSYCTRKESNSPCDKQGKKIHSIQFCMVNISSQNYFFRIILF